MNRFLGPTAVEHVRYDEFKKAVPTLIWNDCAAFIDEAFDGNQEISINMLLFKLYGVITFTDYEMIVNIICTEM